MNKSEVIGDNINALRIDRGYSQEAFADAVGVSQVTVSNWETAAHAPSEKAITKICSVFGVGYDEIVSDENGYAKKVLRSERFVIKPTYSNVAMPVVGDIAAGDPCEAIELIDQELTVPEAFLETHPEARFLRVRGESMNKLFQADSYVLYDPELPVRDGDIAVVYVNGDDATVKRVYFAGDTVVLHPESTMEEHLDRAINTKDPSSPPVTFAGRVFWATWGDKDVRF